MPKKSHLITPAGAQTLKDELNYLWRDKRPKVTQAVKEAAAMGDRSENAEYIYGKKMLREIDRRVYYLQKRLPQLNIISTLPHDQSKVYFGAWVTLEDDNQQTRTLRIVGTDEFDLKKGFISMSSPLAKALMGKQCDDEITLADLGKTYYILDIQYK